MILYIVDLYTAGPRKRTIEGLRSPRRGRRPRSPVDKGKNAVQASGRAEQATYHDTLMRHGGAASLGCNEEKVGSEWRGGKDATTVPWGATRSPSRIGGC